LLEVESSGWRNELRLRVFDGRRHRHPHIEVFHSSDEDVHISRRLLADDRWHTVSISLSSMAPDGSGTGGFYVRVHVDCVPVAGRRVDGVHLPWTQPSHFSGLSYLWIGQKTATDSMLKASCKALFAVTVVTEMQNRITKLNRKRARERKHCGHRRPPIYRSRDPAKFWTKNRLKKALTMGMLISKLPLIFIVAS